MKQRHIRPGDPAGERSPIVELPDVRRMLLTMRAYNEALRCLVYLNAECLDLAARHPAVAVRRQRAELADLLTPIAKGWGTDLGVEVTSLAIQVFGGVGYIEETGVAQYYRDARVAPIYEGTNGIQALDLVSRKVPMRAGAVMGDFLTDIATAADDVRRAGDALAPIGDRLAEAHATLRETTDCFLATGLSDPYTAQAGATPYLRMCGVVTGGWLLARSAMAAQHHLDQDRAGDLQLQQKIVTARFYCDQLLPQAAGLRRAVTAGHADLASASF